MPSASRRRWKRGCLFGAIAFLGLALGSPLVAAAEGVPFSAHMVQHLLLLLVVPLLGTLSLPDGDDPLEVRRPEGPALKRILGSPILGWVSGVSAMGLWHTPALCNAAANEPLVRWVQWVSLLGAGALFWWPVFGPHRSCRLGALSGIGYLLGACVACTLLGIYLTFAPVEVCPAYREAEDVRGLLWLARAGSGLTSEGDRQVGGLLMWVPSCVIYVSASMGLLARWYAAGTVPPLGSKPDESPGGEAAPSREPRHG